MCCNWKKCSQQQANSVNSTVQLLTYSGPSMVSK